MGISEDLQKAHYNSISADYAAHYGDEWSQRYRKRFVNESLFENIDLDGALVLEAMCGSGETTDFLRQKNANITGLDISEEEIENFKKRWRDCDVRCASVRNTGFDDNIFDVVVVVGGLHHVHPHLQQVIEEIHRILKPGGYLCFFEPHKDSFPDIIRKIWYKRDKFFADNEEAIDVEQLRATFHDKFNFVQIEYGGNIGYLIVFNSLVFRIPLSLKPLISPILIFIESLIKPLQTRFTSCFVIGQWRKKDQKETSTGLS